MSLELNINSLVDETVEKTVRLRERWKELSTLLVAINKPFLLDMQTNIDFSGHTYDFDDFLILMFEFTQLTTIFYQNTDAHIDFQYFCTLHTNKLIQLCLDGRLNYVDEIIFFKNQLLWITKL